ncbi:Coenzyme F420 hydrogenase/dehydrogenase, beta subunit C-terminal domain [Cupriavidus yeoncheonensis]|nr:Coenzyme F420 hydrogenase/dehydrogenase, beta subunit C-terminal domain [Cupriavidus yeoncheonensis]
MKLDSAGFLRPQIRYPVSRELDAYVREVCPGVSLDLQNSGNDIHPEWGPITSVHIGWSTDPEVRYRGSSGGGISALLIFLLESGQADFVAHIGVSNDDPFQNVRRISRSRADVLEGAGSRYAPAAPMEAVDSLFSTGERFAFVGKPCDVAAMHAYLRQYPEKAPQVVALLSFICAGVPSMRATLKVLETMGTSPEETVRFSYRGNGWPGLATARTRNGSEFTMDYSASWGNILGRDLQLRCKVCPDGTGEFADIVCGDAWYGEDGYPQFDEQEGRSLVISRTATGERLLREAALAAALCIEPCNVREIARMQPYQQSRKRVSLGRLAAVALRFGFIPKFKGLRLWRASRRGGFMPLLRNFVGTYRRLIPGKAGL